MDCIDDLLSSSESVVFFNPLSNESVGPSLRKGHLAMSETNSTKFEKVFEDELEQIASRRWAANKTEGLSPDSMSTEAIRGQLVGLALSGGGVRSGATSLGVLQSIHENGFLSDVDYLSTVSGGSYAGAFLSSDAVVSDRRLGQEDSQEKVEAIFQEPNGRPSSRMLKFIFGGSYLRDTIGFFNRQMFGMVLILLVVFSALITGSALVAWLVRNLDYFEARYVTRTLGVKDELLSALLPAILCFFLWIGLWFFSYLRRTNSESRTAARYSFYFVAFFLLVGLANIIGTGDLFVGQHNVSSTTSQFLKNSWGWIVAAVAASLVPYFAPKKLLRSGTKPRNAGEKYSFWLATNGLLFGIPFVFIGFMLQENISGVNDLRSGRIVARSELKNWILTQPTNSIWQQIRKNLANDPALAKHALLSDNHFSHSPVRLQSKGDYIEDLRNRFRPEVAKVHDVPWNRYLAKPEIEIEDCFSALTILETEIAIDSERPLWRKWATLPHALFGNIGESFSTTHRLLRDEGMIKNALALWIGDKMKSPDFYKLVTPPNARDEFFAKRSPREIAASLVLKRILDLRDLAGTEDANINNALIRDYENLNREYLLALYPEDVQPVSTIKSFVCLASDQAYRLWVAWIGLLVFLVSSVTVNLNAISCHSFYRNRLSEMWIEEGAGLTAIPLPQLETTQRGYPYPLIVASMAYFGKFDRSASPEPMDHFLFSPLYCGSERLNFVNSSRYMGGRITLSDAVAVSGAAVSIIHIKNALIMFLLFVTNLRLGQWLDNPKQTPSESLGWRDAVAKYFYATPLGLLSGLTKNADDRRLVFVADGGHFENLGVDELFRRRCKLVVGLDAGADPEFKMEDFSRLTRWARMRHGIELTPIGDFGASSQAEFVSQISGKNWTKKTDVPAGIEWSRANYLLWKVRYREVDGQQQIGLFIYIKSTMTGKEPLELIKYQKDNPQFPHDSTSDQFFAPSKFESYRHLGRFLGQSVFQDIRKRVLAREFCSQHDVMECLELSDSLVPNWEEIEGLQPSIDAVSYMFERLEDTSRQQRRKIVRKLESWKLPKAEEAYLLVLGYSGSKDEDVAKTATNVLIENAVDNMELVFSIAEKRKGLTQQNRIAVVELLRDLVLVDGFLSREERKRAIAIVERYRKTLESSGSDLKAFDSVVCTAPDAAESSANSE